MAPVSAQTAVGVIVPVRAPAGYLGLALDSALAQSPPPARVVVVDDASPEPLALSDVHAARCTVVRREERGGPAAARATGLEGLDTPLVALLDCDDLWEPGKLAAQLEVMERHPQVGLCFGRATVIDWRGEPTGHDLGSVPEGLLEPQRMLRHLLENNPIATSSTIMRRSALESSGGFEGESTDDLGCWLRLAEHGAPFYFEPRAAVRYRRHPGGITADIGAGARYALAALDLHGQALDEPTRNRLRRDFLTLLARGEIRGRRYRQARATLREAARWGPLGARERALGMVAGVPGLRGLLGRRDPHASSR